MIIGSRGSQLALWQARWVQARLPGAEVVVIQTTGDRILDVALPQAVPQTGIKGLFTKEIEEALLDRRVDLAVHSLKDLPTQMDPRLVIAAVPAREDVRDAVVGRRLAELAPGARIGTSSLRRASQLRRLRPDLKVENIRGNVDTRLRKLDEGRCDALILAAAGLRRLGLAGRIAELLEPEVMCPAIGQGALAIQCRAEDGETRRLLEPLEDPAARAEVEAERAMLEQLGGGCLVPIGGWAVLRGSQLSLTGLVASPDGSEVVRASLDGPASDPADLGRRAAQQLLDRGAGRILDLVHAP